MLNDKRRAPRRTMRYSAWVALGPDQLLGCALADISKTGGRLDVDDSTKIPDKFVLLLSGSGSARRNCSVVWRKPNQIGVAFERRLAESDRITLAPNIDADQQVETSQVQTSQVEPDQVDTTPAETT